MKNSFYVLAFTSLSFFSIHAKAQDDLLALVDTTKNQPKNEKVESLFKTSSLIDLPTVATVKKGTMDFRIDHRFGNAGAASGGGFHTLYGLDNAEDIRFAFDFGLTDKLSIGIGRSRQFEGIDGNIKYRLLDQTINNHIPFSLAFCFRDTYCPQRSTTFYAGASNDVVQNWPDRFTYVSEMMLARKFGDRLSLEIVPTYVHLNYVLANVNTNNGATNENDVYAIGGGGRYMLTKHFGIIADYYYIISKYRENNPTLSYYNPLSVGIEIETGGHVFHLYFANASGIIESAFIPNTTDSWLNGGYKFGFSISRVFNL
ncbi:MAG: DUF5777 family beta-barrel protein [Bacteroidia bacterium]